MPDAIQLECPHCFTKLKLRDPSILGKKVKCPKCKSAFAAENPADTQSEDDNFLGGLSGLEDEYGPVVQPTLPPIRPKTKAAAAGGSSGAGKSKEKARGRSPQSSEGLPAILWPVCGLVGGSLGGVLWVVITFAVQRQFGIIAWVVGALTGLGVAMAAGRRAGTATGGLAAALAFCVILASKFVLAVLFVNQWAAQLAAPELREQQILVQEADAIAEEQQKQGVKLNWPRGKSLDNAVELSDFPETVVKQARQNWEKQTPRAKEIQKNMGHVAQAGKGFLITLAFIGSFSLFDLLWFFLAMGSAFRLGRGLAH